MKRDRVLLFKSKAPDFFTVDKDSKILSTILKYNNKSYLVLENIFSIQIRLQARDTFGILFVFLALGNCGYWWQHFFVTRLHITRVCCMFMLINVRGIYLWIYAYCVYIIHDQTQTSVE